MTQPGSFDPALHAPTLERVGALLHVRTAVGNNEYRGTFDEDTFPTGAQVTVLCAQAARDLRRDVARDIPAGCVEDATDVAVYRAAVLVETSYFLDEEDSAARRTYAATYLDGVKSVRECAANTDPADPEQEAPGPSVINGMGTIGVRGELAYEPGYYVDPEDLA